MPERYLLMLYIFSQLVPPSGALKGAPPTGARCPGPEEVGAALIIDLPWAGKVPRDLAYPRDLACEHRLATTRSRSELSANRGALGVPNRGAPADPFGQNRPGGAGHPATAPHRRTLRSLGKIVLAGRLCCSSDFSSQVLFRLLKEIYFSHFI